MKYTFFFLKELIVKHFPIHWPKPMPNSNLACILLLIAEFSPSVIIFPPTQKFPLPLVLQRSGYFFSPTFQFLSLLITLTTLWENMSFLSFCDEHGFCHYSITRSRNWKSVLYPPPSPHVATCSYPTFSFVMQIPASQL